jgi:hypothetical protein
VKSFLLWVRKCELLGNIIVSYPTIDPNNEPGRASSAVFIAGG